MSCKSYKFLLDEIYVYEIKMLEQKNSNKVPFDAETKQCTAQQPLLVVYLRHLLLHEVASRLHIACAREPNSYLLLTGQLLSSVLKSAFVLKHPSQPNQRTTGCFSSMTYSSHSASMHHNSHHIHPCGSIEHIFLLRLKPQYVCQVISKDLKCLIG